MKVAVVCESEYDKLAIEAYVRALGTVDSDTSFHCLQPNTDASSRADGGWARVLGWIRRHAGAGIAGLFTVPLFEGQAVYDRLIIHIDGDVVDRVVAACDGVRDERELSEFLAALIKDQLNVDESIHQRIAFAIPVQCTESWIIAALSEDDISADEIDAKSEYRRRFEIGKRGNRRDAFVAALRQIAPHMKRASERSPSFARFVEHEAGKLAA